MARADVSEALIASCNISIRRATLPRPMLANAMRAVAVPVFNSQSHAFASLATAVPVFRMSVEALVALVPLLQSAAAELSARLPQQ